ncbi:MAG: tetratricopeptide repeat protein [Phycisphaerae bacterium]|nr:tetratricopeptide repeat protein [Phycisphaerae bacterium]
MAHVKCSKCGERLRLPSLQEAHGIRCPACKHEFVVSPPRHPQSLPDEYTGEGGGIVAKTAYTVLGAVLIAAIAILIYTSVVGPGSSDPDPLEPVVAKDTDPEPPSPKTKLPKERRSEPKKTPATKPVAKPASLSPEQIFAKASPSVVYIVVRDRNFKPIGLGSGFFIDSKGLIATNHHVIKGAEFATVLLRNKSTLFVDGVTAVDADSDLAILQVSGKGFPSLKAAADTPPKIGSAAYAIGNPRGLANTFSSGMISGHREFKEGVKVIQTTAPISPGSSGGPLLDNKGEVVGITTSHLKGSQNLNFAVPIATLRSLIRKQEKVKTLASAGGGKFNTAETKELDKVWAAIEKKDWTTATRILIALRKTQKENPIVWFAIGYLHWKLGNHEIAIQHYKMAITLKPDYSMAYNNVGCAYFDLGRYADASVALKTAISLKPDNDTAYANMGRLYCMLKQYTKALAACKKAIGIEPDAFFANRNLGLAYSGLGRYAEAVAAFEKAIAIKSNHAGVYYDMGIALYDLRRYAEALAACKKVIALKPDNARAYSNMGVVYGKLGKRAEALAACKKAIALDPDDSVAYSNLGSAYDAQGRYPEAITSFKKAIALKPDDAGVYYDMGRTLHRFRRYTEAIAAYKKVVALKPDHADAYYEMGIEYGMLTRFANAIAAYKKAIALKPDHAGAYLLMGLCYEKLKQYTLAIAAYRKSIALEPAGETADRARKAIRQIQKE